jgi:hypothetical protein
MKVEIISISLLAHSLNHTTSSGVESIKFEKKGFFQNALKYIEDHITKHGMDIINVHGSEQMYMYHLIKR